MQSIQSIVVEKMRIMNNWMMDLIKAYYLSKPYIEVPQYEASVNLQDITDLSPQEEGV